MKYLQDTLREEFGKRSIADVEMPKYFATSLNPMMKLRPYQEECFKYFITYWKNDFDAKELKPHLLFHMATGSGKTLIWLVLCSIFTNRGIATSFSLLILQIS